MQLGQFGCLTNVGGKRAELVQKFMPRNRIGIFRNERTRSTPLHRNLMFWCVYSVLVHLGMFYYDSKLGAKWAELVQKFVPRSRVVILRTHPIHAIRP